MLQLHMLQTSPASSPSPRILCFRDSPSSPPQSLRGHSPSNPRKTSRVSLARAPDGHFSLKCRQSEYFDQQQRFASSTLSDNSTSFSPSGGGTMSPKVFVGHSIYKGKAALTVEPRAPEFTSLDSGAYKLSREGFVLLQFAPAAGTRVYDWSRKQVFSLSVTEIGNLIALGPRDSCEFFHDPFKGKSDEGKIRKVLNVEPLPDGSGHFFNLSINLSQRKYVLDILDEVGYLGVKPVDTPMEPNVKLDAESGDLLHDLGKYRRLVGKVNYLTVTRPDICFSVSVISQFMSSPRTTHWDTLLRIIKYLGERQVKGYSSRIMDI